MFVSKCKKIRLLLSGSMHGRVHVEFRLSGAQAVPLTLDFEVQGGNGLIMEVLEKHAKSMGSTPESIEAVLLDGREKLEGGWLTFTVGRASRLSPEVAKSIVKEAPDPTSSTTVGMMTETPKVSELSRSPSDQVGGYA